MDSSLEKLGRNKIALILLAAWTLPYFVLNHLATFRTTFFDFSMPIDQKIPFIIPFIFVYVLLYVFVPLPYFLVKDDSLFRTTAKAYLSAFTVIYLFFLFLPGKMALPTIPPDGIASWLLAFIRSAEHPHNLLPSVHVTMSMLSALACTHYKRIYGIIVLPLAVLIAISTIFVKQHYVLDIVAGAVLAFVIYYYFFIIKQEPAKKLDQ